MTLRTPRRRISPRTRKRYRAIKDFFKRAIGSTSQPDIEINSSIAINVTDLKHKIVGLEQQLSEVGRTCREFIYLDGSGKGSQSLIPTELNDEQRDDQSRKESRKLETKILYKTSESHYRNSEGSSKSTPKQSSDFNDVCQNKIMNDYVTNASKSKNKNRILQNKDKDLGMNQNFHKHITQAVEEKTTSSLSSSNLHTLRGLREIRHPDPGYSEFEQIGRNHKKDRNDHCYRNDVIHNERRTVPTAYDRHAVQRTVKHSRNRKPKHESDTLDQDFIADIIRRQYKPVKMFGRRESELSQFSEPMCRDREYTHNEHKQEGTELCSCCYGGSHSPRHTRHVDNSDARSICDTRLYSSKRNARFKYRRVQADAYNDSELYDLIPVRERCSPKTRKKIAQDNLATYNAYREVPPSPRTHKPRLNLKAQYYTESDDHIDFIRHGSRRVSPKSHRKYQEPLDNFENEHSQQLFRARRHRNKQKLLRNREQVQEMETMSSLQYPQHFNLEQNNTTIDTALNKTQETVSSTDKTDRALFEIKDILQTFLQEIKKEASSSGKSDVSAKMNENCINNQNIPQTNTNGMPNSGHSFNNYNVPHCSSAPTPYMPPYPSACCYPIVPMYPMNCMQNGYAMPSQSFTCCPCANKTDDATDKSKANNNGDNEAFASETDELIKEIYKMVAQSPTLSRKQDHNQTRNYNSGESRILTSRSAGRSTPASKHDARVGTPRLQCYSKSCEAIGSRMVSETYYSGTNAVYSDTILENLSLEATATTSSEADLSTEQYDKKKGNNNKFTKVLRSFGLLKKKKETIEEQSETDSTIDVEIKKKPPFRQEVTNYMMHGQEYYRPPPVSQDYRPHHYSHEHHRPTYNPAYQNYPPPEHYHDPRMQQPMQDHHPPRYPGPYPTAPLENSYGNYGQIPPQVPLCLKEIEVKSMGTQSERKMSFFRKIKQKIQPPLEQSRLGGAKNCSTQTAQGKPGMFNWKNMQPKATDQNDPMAFSFKTRMNLAEGDNKMRNAMLKKLFYKRNPFSPRNLIMKTLLGNDNFEPPKAVRPRMFL